MKAAPKIGPKDVVVGVVFNKPKTFVDSSSPPIQRGTRTRTEQLLLCGSASSENDATKRIQQIEVRMN